MVAPVEYKKYRWSLYFEYDVAHPLAECQGLVLSFRRLIAGMIVFS